MKTVLLLLALLLCIPCISQDPIADERELYSSIYTFSHDLPDRGFVDTSEFFTWYLNELSNRDTSYKSLVGFNKKETKKFNKAIKKHLDGMVYIPSGSSNVGSSDQDLPFAGQRRSRIATIQGFYMLNHELTVAEYLDYLNEAGDKAKGLYPHSENWKMLGANYDSLELLYMNDEAFANHPVVNLSYEQVFAYCKWLTTKLRADPEINNPNIIARIAFENEWEYAARGGLDLSPYPWGGPYLRNSKGCYLANFRIIDPLRAVYGKDSTPWLIPQLDLVIPLDDLHMTQDVYSYHPNGYGLYNMAGNAAEFVMQHGMSRGGSFYETGYYLQNSVRRFYDRDNSALPSLGLRIVVTL